MNLITCVPCCGLDLRNEDLITAVAESRETLKKNHNSKLAQLHLEVHTVAEGEKSGVENTHGSSWDAHRLTPAYQNTANYLLERLQKNAERHHRAGMMDVFSYYYSVRESHVAMSHFRPNGAADGPTGAVDGAYTELNELEWKTYTTPTNPWDATQIFVPPALWMSLDGDTEFVRLAYMLDVPIKAVSSANDEKLPGSAEAFYTQLKTGSKSKNAKNYGLPCRPRNAAEDKTSPRPKADSKEAFQELLWLRNRVLFLGAMHDTVRWWRKSESFQPPKEPNANDGSGEVQQLDDQTSVTPTENDENTRPTAFKLDSADYAWANGVQQAVEYAFYTALACAESRLAVAEQAVKGSSDKMKSTRTPKAWNDLKLAAGAVIGSPTADVTKLNKLVEMNHRMASEFQYYQTAGLYQDFEYNKRLMEGDPRPLENPISPIRIGQVLELLGGVDMVGPEPQSEGKGGDVPRDGFLHAQGEKKEAAAKEAAAKTNKNLVVSMAKSVQDNKLSSAVVLLIIGSLMTYGARQILAATGVIGEGKKFPKSGHNEDKARRAAEKEKKALLKEAKKAAKAEKKKMKSGGLGSGGLGSGGLGSGEQNDDDVGENNIMNSSLGRDTGVTSNRPPSLSSDEQEAGVSEQGGPQGPQRGIAIQSQAGEPASLMRETWTGGGRQIPSGARGPQQGEVMFGASGVWQAKERKSDAPRAGGSRANYGATGTGAPVSQSGGATGSRDGPAGGDEEGPVGGF